MEDLCLLKFYKQRLILKRVLRIRMYTLTDMNDLYKELRVLETHVTKTTDLVLRE